MTKTTTEIKANGATPDKIARKVESRVARPLKILVPLIKQHLRKIRVFEQDAGMDEKIACGGELIEAKSQKTHGEWGDWLKRNFTMSKMTASRYMRLAVESNRGVTFTSVSDFMRKTGAPAYNVRSIPAPVREKVEQAKREMQNFAKADRSRAQERDAERRLGLQLIDIGYKILAVKLHPDKMSGSHEAMRRLNAERARLKEAA